MAKGTLLTDAERVALRGLPDKAKLIYLLGIRPYMDYATGIVGIKRKVSWQGIAEELYVEPIAGVPKSETGSPSEQQLRRAKNHLEKAGLIKTKSTRKQLIFYCLLAVQDKSVQNQADSKNDARPTSNNNTRPTASDNPQSPVNTEFRLETDALGRQQNTPSGRHQKMSQADTPPVEDKNKKQLLRSCKKGSAKKRRSLPDDFQVNENHLANANKNGWPSPHEEIEAFRDWHLAKGSLFLDWDRAFYTWLRNAKRFRDKGARYETGSRSNNANNKPNSITRSVNAYIRKKQDMQR